MAKNKLNYWDLADEHKALHILKNRSVVKTEEVQAMLRESQADLTDEAIQDELDRIGMRSVGGGTHITSEGLYNAETAIYKTAVGRAQETVHHLPDEVVESVISGRETMRDEQADAVRHAAKSGGISVVEGAAGVGKSYTMDAVRDAFEQSGYQVLGTAPSNVAVNALKDGSNIKSSNTMYSLYQQIARGEVVLDPKTVIIADEAGMADSKSMARIMSMAHETGAKVIPLGDRYQLESIGSASLFAKIGDKIGKADMVEIARQDDPELQAISRNFYNGNADQAFKDAERLGMISTSTDPVSAAAEKYLSYTAAGKDTIVVAGTNKNVGEVNDKIIEALKEQGELSDSESADFTLKDRHGKEIEKTLYKGQKIMFRQGNKDLDISNGDTGKITGINGDVLTVEKSDGSSVDVDTSEYQRIEDGYAMTVHKSQGVTVDKTVLLADKQTMDLRLAYVAMTRGREGTDLVAHPDDLVAIKFKAMESSAKETVIDVMSEDELTQLDSEVSASTKAVEASGQDLPATHGIMYNDSISEQQAEFRFQSAYNELASADISGEMDTDPSKTLMDTAGDYREFDEKYPAKMADKFGMSSGEAQAQAAIDRLNTQENKSGREDIAALYRDGTDHSSLVGIKAEKAQNNDEGVEQHKNAMSSRMNAGNEVLEGGIEQSETTQKAISDFVSREDLDEKALKSAPSYLLRASQAEAIAQDKGELVASMGEEIERRERIGDRYSEMGSDDLKDRLEFMSPEVFYDLMIGNAPSAEDRERNKQIFKEGVDERMTGMQVVNAYDFAAKYEKEESALARRAETTELYPYIETSQNLDKYKNTDLEATQEDTNLETLKTHNQSEKSVKENTRKERLAAISRISPRGVQRLNERSLDADKSTPEGREALKEELAAIRSRQELLKNDNDGSIQNFEGSVESYRRDLLIEAGRDRNSLERKISQLEASGDFRKAMDLKDAATSRDSGQNAAVAKHAGDHKTRSRESNKAGVASNDLNKRLFRDREHNNLQKRFERKARDAGLTESEFKEVEQASRENLDLAGNITSEVSSMSVRIAAERGLTREQASALMEVDQAELSGGDKALDDLMDRTGPADTGNFGETGTKIEQTKAEIARDEFVSSVDDNLIDSRVGRLTERGMSEEKAKEAISNVLYAKHTIQSSASTIAESKLKASDRFEHTKEFLDSERQDNKENLENLIELEGSDRLQSQIGKMQEIEQKKLEKMQDDLKKVGKDVKKSDRRIDNLNKEIERQSEQKTKFFGLLKADSETNNISAIRELEDERVLEIQHNEDMHVNHQMMKDEVKQQRETVKAMEVVSRQVETLDQNLQQQEEKRLKQEEVRANQEAAERQQKVEQEAQEKADQINQFKEDESQYQGLDNNQDGLGDIHLIQDEPKRKELEEQRAQAQKAKEEFLVRNAALQKEIEETIAIAEERIREEDLLYEEQYGQDEDEAYIESYYKMEESKQLQYEDQQEREKQEEALEQDEDEAYIESYYKMEESKQLQYEDQQEHEKQEEALEQDEDPDSGDDADPNANKEGSEVNYSRVNAQKADEKVEQAKESNEYQEAKTTSISSGSDMLSMLGNEIDNQVAEKKNQDQSKDEAKDKDQSQSIDESDNDGQTQNQGEDEAEKRNEEERQRLAMERKREFEKSFLLNQS